MASKVMTSKLWRWRSGLLYILAVAAIWIAAIFVVQSVVDAGVSPFLVTYICNSLFIIYIPLVEIGRYLEDTYGSLMSWRNKKSSPLQELGESEEVILLGEGVLGPEVDGSNQFSLPEEEEISLNKGDYDSNELSTALRGEVTDTDVDAKGRWTRTRVIRITVLLDNVLSDYLWAKAVLLTTTTVATAGLTIQVPLAALVDTFIGNAPHLMDYIGAAAVMIGFAGMNIASDIFGRSKEASLELENKNLSTTGEEHISSSNHERVAIN